MSVSSTSTTHLPFDIVIKLTVSNPNDNNGFTSKVYLHPIQVNHENAETSGATEINSSTKEKDIIKIISEGLSSNQDALNKFNDAYNLTRSWRQIITRQDVTIQSDLKTNAISALKKVLGEIETHDNIKGKKQFSPKYLNLLNRLLKYIESSGDTNSDNNNQNFKIDDDYTTSTTFNYTKAIKDAHGWLSLLPGNLERINFVNDSKFWADNEENSDNEVRFPGWKSSGKFGKSSLFSRQVNEPYFTTETEFLEAMLKTRTNQGGSRRKRRVNSKLTRRQNK